MRFTFTAVTLIWSALTLNGARAQINTTEWPLHNDGLTKRVEWDHYSFMVDNQRLFIFSGEFHYWRFPVPELWRDLLEKVKAAGFNAFSIYNSWGFHNPAHGVLDFENGAHNFTSVMALAKELGMYLLIRPGPYVNAEANAGGFPLWVTTGDYGALRDDDPRYTAAWKPYWTRISEIIKPHLITNGGNVIMFQIENELGGQWADIATRTPNPRIDNYMELLEDTARSIGIDIPLTHNLPNMGTFSWSKDFSNVTGNVDVVGVDSYPSCWSCNLNECTGTNGQYVAYQTANYYDYFGIQSPTQPNFLPEFQGGSYNPWGGPEGGCPNDIGADFANMFYRNLISQRVTAISLYMLYGGTNWGWMAAPVVASSYDYSSPVSENREIGSKYYETKLLTLFTRVAKDLALTNRVGNSTAYSNNSAISTSELRNPSTNAAFYVTMHSHSPSSTLETFSLNVNTSAGLLGIPQYGGCITLNGHQAKIIVTDFRFGNRNLLYSTAEVLTYTVLDGQEVLVLWTPSGESGEFTVEGISSASLAKSSTGASTTVKFFPGISNITINFVNTSGMTVVNLEGGGRVVLLDRKAAYHFWVPTLGNDPLAPENDTILVHGPYLVRSASLAHGTLQLTGDVDNSTQTLTVFAPNGTTSLSWNGEELSPTSRDGNMIMATVQGPGNFNLPPLSSWVVHNSLPEISPDYRENSNTWITANKLNTSNSVKPALNNPILYVDEYDIHVGHHIYRAMFSTNSQNPPTGVWLQITGGNAFGYSAWLNGHYIGSYYGLSSAGTGAMEFSFANATLQPAGSGSSQGADNVLVVVMDNSGHDLREAALAPRGIINATLTGPAAANYSFNQWKIAGTAGSADGQAARNLIDPIRGPLNEGGLYAERVGMHLPGYPVSSFNSSSWSPVPSNASTLAVPNAGILAFRTVVPLSVPAGLDVSISFRLTAPGTSNNSSSFLPTVPSYSNRVRALLFVNGYQFGRFNPYIGNQIDFPVPPGVLNYSGDNTILVTVWSQSSEGAEIKVEWNTDYIHSTGFDFGFDSAYLRPGWTSERLSYA